MTINRRFATRTLWLLSALVLASCFGESTGPERRLGHMALLTQMAPHALRLVNVNSVHIVIVQPGTNVVIIDTTVIFPPNTDTLDLNLPVPISGTSQQFDLTLDMLDASNLVVFHSGPTTVTAAASGVPNPPVPLVINYVGVGSHAAGVRFTSAPASVFFGDSVTFVAEAYDSQSVTIPNTPILYLSSDTTTASVPNEAAGKVIAKTKRGTVQITAQLLTPPNLSKPLAVQPVPTSISITSGNAQSGTVGQALPQTVTARVIASDNLGVAGVVVTWSVTAGGGSLSKTTDTTNANGDVSVAWTLGTVPGGGTMTVTATGIATPATGTSTAQAGAPKKLVFQVQPSNATANVAITPAIKVAAQDSFGNATAGFTGNVTLTFGNNPSGATLTGAGLVAAVGGVATFSNVQLNNAGTGYTLVAGAAGLTSATSTTFNVTGGVPTQLAFSQQPASAAGGASLGTIQIEVRDVNGNLVSNATSNVTLALTTGTGTAGAHLGGTLTAAASAGVATFAGLSIDSAGASYTLTASSGALTSAISASFNITAGAATHLAFAAQPVTTTAGGAITPVVKVAVKDAIGNTVTADNATSITVAITAATGTSGAALAGTRTLTVAAGVAAFSNLSIDSAGTGYTLTATSSPVLTQAISSAFNIGIGAASHLAFTVQPTTVSAGSAIAPAVKLEVKDAIGNTIATDNATSVTVAITTATGTVGAALAGTKTLTVVAGVATFNNLAIDSAGTGYTLAATASGLTGATSSAFNITAGAATALAFTTQPATATAGAGFGFVVTARDGVGNTAVGFTGNVSVAITSGTGKAGAQLTGTATVAAVAGVATFSGLKVDSAAAGYTLLATATGPSSATSNSFNITAGAASVLVFTTQPPTSIAFASFGAVVTARDNQGNVATAFTGNVAVAITGGTGTAAAHLVGTTTVAATSGVATLSGLSIDSVGTGYTLTATATGPTATTSNPFDITFAALRTWTGAVSSAWLVNGNWSPAAAPGAGNDVVIPSAPATQPVLSSAATVNSVTVQSGATLTLNAGSLTTTTGLADQGTVVASGTSSISGPVTTTATSVLRIGQVDGSTSLANLTVAAGFTNNGTIDLTTSFAVAYSAQLTVTSGTLTNASGGSITASPGAAAGGSRTISAQLNNLGTVTASTGMTLASTSAAHTNSGTINLAGADLSIIQSGASPSFTNTGTITVGVGRTLSITNGAFAQQTGATLNGGGNLVLAGATAGLNTSVTLATLSATSATVNLGVGLSTSSVALSLTGTTVNGPGTLTNASGKTLTMVGSTLNGPVSNQGTLLASDASAINGALTTASGSILRVEQITGNTSQALLAVANGFTNNGAIELSVAFAAAYDAQLAVAAGTLVNSATGTISALGGAAPGGLRILAAELNNQGTVTASVGLSLGRPSAAHVNSGTISVSGGDLALTQSGTTPSFTNTGTLTVSSGRTLTVTGGAFTEQTGATLNGGGALVLNGTTAAVNTAFTLATIAANNATLSFGQAVSTANFALSLNASTVNGPGPLTNATGQTITMSFSTLGASLPVDNQGTLVASGASAINGALTTGNASTLRIGQIDGSTSQATLTVAGGFTNNGLIELTVSTVLGAYGAQLTVTSGTLTNAATGTIAALPGLSPGGARVLAATLDNQGTLSATGSMSVPNAVTSTGFLRDTLGVLTLGGGGSLAGTAQSLLGNLTLGGGDFSLSGDFSVNGGLSLSGTGVLDNFNGHTLTVSQDLSLSGNSRVDMSQATDSISVGGSVLWNTNSTVETLSNGVIVVGGSFSQGGAANSFKASGAHRVVLNGSANQSIGFASHDSTTSHFQHLIVASSPSLGADTLKSDVVVNGSFSIRGTASLVSLANERLIVRDTVFGSVGTSLTPKVVAVGRVLADTGTFSPDTTIFLARGAPTQQVIPTYVVFPTPVAYKNVVIDVGAATGGTAGPPPNAVTTFNGSAIARGNGVLYLGITTTLNVNGDLMTAGNGSLDMDNTSTLLTVAGKAVFGGGADATLESGLIQVAGDFSQSGNAQSFAPPPTSTLRVRLNGAGRQLVSFQNADSTQSYFRVLEVTNPSAGGIRLATNVVADSVALTGAGANVRDTLSGSTVIIRGGGISDNSGITGGGWQATNTLFSGAVTNLPDTMTTNAAFAGATALPIFAPPYTIHGDVTISGASANLSTPLGTNTIYGSLTTTNGGTLTMHYPSIECGICPPPPMLTVTGNATFSGGDETGLLNIGTLAVGGNFAQSGPSNSFTPSSNHVTLLNGSSAQTISFANSSTSGFQALSASNGSGVTFLNNALVNGNVTLDLGTVSGSATVTVVGGITDCGGECFGSWNVANTVFSGAPGILPSQANTFTTDATFSGTAVVPNSFTLHGKLTVTGSLDLSSNGPVHVTGDFETQASGKLMMTLGGTMIVDGNATFNGAAEDSSALVAAGTLWVGGNFTQTSLFQPSANYLLDMHGTGTQSVSMTVPGGGSTDSWLGQFGISNTGSSGVSLSSDVFAYGSLGDTAASLVPKLIGNGHIVRVTGVSVTRMTIDNAPLIVSDGSTLDKFDNVTFQGAYASSADILTFNRVGQASPFAMDGVTFPSLPSSGHYLVLNDTDGSANGYLLNVNLTNATPLTFSTTFVNLINGANGLWNGASMSP